MVRAIVLRAGTGSLMLLILLAVSFPAAANESGDMAYLHAGCAACHQADGSGIQGMYPRLTGRVAEIVQIPDGKSYLVSVVAFGLSGCIEIEDRSICGFMPAHPDLDDVDMAAVLNWLANPDGRPEDDPFNSALVHEFRENKLDRSEVRKLRDKVLPGGALESDGKPGSASDDLANVRRWHPDPAWSRNPAPAGERKYRLNCSGCHGLDGDATIPSVPNLSRLSGYFAQTPRGRAFLVRTPGNAMSPMSDAETALVTNWFLREFSGAELPDDFKPFSAEEVHRLRAKPLTYDYVAERREVIAELRQKGIMPPADQMVTQKMDWVFSGSPSSIPFGSGVVSRPFDANITGAGQGIW